MIIYHLFDGVRVDFGSPRTESGYLTSRGDFIHVRPSEVFNEYHRLDLESESFGI